MDYDLKLENSKWEVIQNFKYVKCEYIKMPKIKDDIMWLSNKKVIVKMVMI